MKHSLNSLSQFVAGGEVVNGSMFGSTDLSFGASDVECFGREFYISECRNESVIPAECTASRVAGARCVPGSSKSTYYYNNIIIMNERMILPLV
jgi:hypothetical protein